MPIFVSVAKKSALRQLSGLVFLLALTSCGGGVGSDGRRFVGVGPALQVLQPAFDVVLARRLGELLLHRLASALDVEAESALYAALIRLVREGGGSIISIGHRPGLGALHDEIWTIQDCAEGDGGAPRCLATA